MITTPIPDALDASVLVAELEAAGFTDVAITKVGDDLEVSAAELTDVMPPAAERDACATQDELDVLLGTAADAADAANAGHRKAIAAVVAQHHPPPAEVDTSRADALDAIDNAKSLDELKDALKSVLGTG